MKIKLLHAVLHDGDVLEPGVIADIAELAAVSLVAAGAAEEVEEPDAPEPAKTDPAGTPDTGAAKTDTGAEAAANTTADTGKTKAAKTAEGK